MRRLTGRKFVGVGRYSIKGTYDRQRQIEISDIIDNMIELFKQTTGQLPDERTYPCPYYKACDEDCFITKAYHCNEYARRERIKRLYGG